MSMTMHSNREIRQMASEEPYPLKPKAHLFVSVWQRRDKRNSTQHSHRLPHRSFSTIPGSKSELSTTFKLGNIPAKGYPEAHGGGRTRSLQITDLLRM